MADVDKTVHVTVFDIGDGIASARAEGQLWYDLLQLAKLDGEWQLVNVLWASNQADGDQGDPRGTRADTAAVEQAAMDYVDGLFAGDAERVTRALHPEVNNVQLRRHPQTNRSYMSKTGVATLIEVAAAGLNNVEESQRNIAVEVYDVSHGIAAARVTSSRATEYLQIGKVNGEWKVINTLWVPNA
jgi:hypothetical protein